jgi:hypothetical protein
MPKKSVLVMKLFSRRPLTADVAATHLGALMAFEHGVFVPEKCDVYEPLRESFDSNDLTEPIRWLSQPGGEMKFRRSRPIRIEGYIENAKFPKMWFQEPDGKRSEFKPKVSEPIFCTRWVVWIDEAAGLRKGVKFLKRFLSEMFRAATADYGSLATEADYNRKNFLVTSDSLGTLERYVGQDPEKGLPGLYWMNLFGPLYVDWFGREPMKQVPATLVEEYQDGSVLLQFGETPADSEAGEAQAQQKMAVRILGEDTFFDISRPDRALAVPDFRREYS